MRIIIALVLSLASIVVPVSVPAGLQTLTADIIFMNGNIYTVDPRNPRAGTRIA